MAQGVSEQTASPRETAWARAGILTIAAYIAAQMMSDIGSLKIATVAGFSIDGGTFIYPLTFTLRDMVAKLPPDPTWPLQQAFADVLSPVWRIVLASIVAEVVSELLDTELYQLWVSRITRRYQWARVLVSNGVSVPVDSLIFVWIAFGGALPTAVVWSVFWANVLVKGMMTLISLPAIYLVKEA